MRDGFAGTNSRQNHVFLALSIRGDDDADGPADHLAGGVAEYALGGAIPGGNVAVQILADDGVVGGFDDAGEMADCDRIRELMHGADTQPPEELGNPSSATHTGGVTSVAGRRSSALAVPCSGEWRPGRMGSRKGAVRPAQATVIRQVFRPARQPPVYWPVNP